MKGRAKRSQDRAELIYHCVHKVFVHLNAATFLLLRSQTAKKLPLSVFCSDGLHLMCEIAVFAHLFTGTGEGLRGLLLLDFD